MNRSDRSIWYQIIIALINLAFGLYSARLLGSETIGIFAIFYFVISFSNVLIEAGLTGAIIRTPIPTELMFNTAYTINMAVSIIISLACVIVGILLHELTEQLTLAYLFISSPLILIYSSLSFAGIARLLKKEKVLLYYKFKLSAVVIAVLLSVLYMSFFRTITALWIYQFVNIGMLASCVIIYTGIPKFAFDQNSFSEIKSFSINTLGASVLTALSDALLAALIPKHFSYQLNGYYSLGRRISETPYNALLSVVQNVVYPSLCNCKSDDSRRMVLRRSFLLYFEIPLIISVLSLPIHDDLIQFFLGHEWLRAIPFIRLYIVVGLLTILELFYRIELKRNDKTFVLLKVEMPKKILLFIVFYVFILWQDIRLFSASITLPIVFSIFYLSYHISIENKWLVRQVIYRLMIVSIGFLLYLSCVLSF